MRLLWFALLIAALPTAKAGAQSQPGASQDTGTLVRRAPPASVEGETKTAAREATRQFGVCVVSRSPSQALKVIDLPVDQPDHDRLLRRLATDDCIAYGELTIPAVLMRAAIFEALYAREFGRAGEADFTSVPPIDYPRGYQSPLSPRASNVVALALVGDCLARSDGKAARYFLASRPGAAAEDEALMIVMRHLSPCIPQGQTIRFSRSVLKGAVAEALYRLARAQETAE